MPAPAVIGVFYYGIVITVNQTDNVVLPVADIVVIRTVVVHGDRVPVRVIAEQQLVAARHLRNQHRTMIPVLCRRPVHRLLRAQPVLIVRIRQRISIACRPRQPPPLPRHRVAPVGRRVPARIVPNRFPVVARQLIRPRLVLRLISIGDRVRCRPQRAAVRNVGILGLIQNVATIIVGVRDRLVEDAVVLANKLIQRIVLVIEVRITLLNVGNVPVRIILVLVRGVAAVLICRDKPGRLIRSVSRYIGQRRDIVARKPDLSACQSAERVIIKA